MPKVIVWRCDKCQRTVEQDTFPSGWRNACVYEGDDKTADLTGCWLWCQRCWDFDITIQRAVEATKC